MVVYIDLYHFNNYYNRQLLKYDLPYEYGTPIVELPNVMDFNPGDGVNTTHTINHRVNIDNVDYALIRDSVDGGIISRWFVLDGTYTRQGQTIITLKRDSIADHYDAVLTAPMFIEKATVADTSPLIFNREGLTVNQIKLGEVSIQDETKCGWLVGYLDRNYNPATGTEDDPLIEFEATATPSLVLDRLSDYAYYPYMYYNYFDKSQTTLALEFVAQNHSPIAGNYQTRYRYSSLSHRWQMVESGWGGDGWALAINNYLVNNPDKEISDDVLWTGVANFNNYLSADGYNELVRENNRLIKVNDKDRIEQIVATVRNGVELMNSGYAPAFNPASVLNNWINSLPARVRPGNIVGAVTVKTVTNCVVLNNTSTQIGSYHITMPDKNNRLHLTDAPYDMFCIPYGDNLHVVMSLPDPYGFDITLSKETALSVAQGLQTNIGKYVYDIQILPYCPVANYFTTSADGTITSSLPFKNYDTVLDDQDNVIAPVYWCTKSKDDFYNATQILIQNYKMANETQFIRLCSPNYNGLFEMTPARNRHIFGFHIIYDYKPYSPYIHVVPQFNENGLYGGNFKDARGLICQGDFSITSINSSWTDYVNQNKNFENVFNREVENLETNYEIAREQRAYAAVGAGLAAMANGAKGGAPGVAQGVVQATGIAVAGAINEQLMKAKQDETIDFKTDLFNFNLDNIKAMPNSVGKVTALTVDNKVWPFIEFYGCTQEERMAIANKIRYNGMTVGTIGTMAEYLPNRWSYEGIEDRGYIKGKLINTADIDCDYHMATDIAEELNKGVYTH